MRQDLNEKILYLIRNNRADEFGITPEDIYNAYTGSGGLHGLNGPIMTAILNTVKPKRK